MDYVYELNLYKKGAITKKDDFYSEPYCFPLITTNNNTRNLVGPLHYILQENKYFRFTKHHYVGHGNQPWSEFIRQQTRTSINI